MTRAAIYARISRDEEGTRLGVARQEEDCHALAARHGYDVAGVYVDNDISASTLSKKARPQYEAMLRAAKAGEVDVILAYSNSRLTRRLLELEDLIQLHERHGTQIATVVSGQDDLSTADGRMVARIKASVDSAEAERTGERLRRAHQQRAQRGVAYHGKRPFGWAEDKRSIDPAEAALIREAARDLLHGVPLRTVAATWNAAGVATSRDGEWSHTTVRRLLQRPRLVGHVVHRGKVVTDAAGAPLRGDWEPVLDEPTFNALQELFRENSRGGGRRGARQYVLSGILRCGTCGARMSGTATRSAAGYAYTCAGGEPSTHSVTIVGPLTEEAVLAVAHARLSAETLPEVGPVPDPSPDLRSARIGEQIAELMGAYRAGQLSAGLVFPQVQHLEEERAQLAADAARRAVAGQRPAVAEPDQLLHLDADRQRAVLETLFDAVVIRPAAHRGEPWNPDRITYVWRAS